MVTGLFPALIMIPDSRIITEKAAPKAAALDTPRVNGEPRRFRSMDCMEVPATERPMPAVTAVRA